MSANPSADSPAPDRDRPEMIGGSGDHQAAHLAAEALAPSHPDAVRAVLAPLVGKRITHQGFFSDGPDKWLFMLFAIVGFTLTFAAKSAGLTGLPIALLPVAVLIGYAVISTCIEKFRLHPDRLGDNCYYMGFIFTLASLSAALVEVQGRAGDARNALLEQLIGSFGIALFSTITGIVLRVFFMQMRREVEDIEEEIRNDLQEAAQRLKDQLGTAVENLEGFRTRTEQVMNEQFVATAAEFSRVSFALAKNLSASGAAHAAAAERLSFSAGEAASKLAQAADAMTEQMRASVTLHQDATKRLTASSEKVVSQVGRLVDRIDKIEVPGDLLTRQVDEARQRIGTLATAFENTLATDIARQNAAQQATASLERLLGRLSDLSAFEAIEESVARLRTVVEQTAGAILVLATQLATHERGFAAAVADAERDRVAVAQARASVESDLAQSTAALRQLRETLTDVADNLVMQLGTP